MLPMMSVILLILAGLLVKTKLGQKSAAQQLAATVDLLNQTTGSLEAANDRVAALSKYQGLVDTEAEAQRILADAAKASAKAKEITDAAEAEAAQRTVRAEAEARRILDEAEAKAKGIAGEAYDIKEKADEYRRTATAMRNLIEGYGDEWLKPTYSLLDELPEAFDSTEAGKMLEDARAHTAQMIKTGLAAECDYAEKNRRETAINFVIDAFNGKVDSILSKSQKENYGTLAQMIRDAFQLVNYNGQAFRNARITAGYLDARLQELNWTVALQELLVKEGNAPAAKAAPKKPAAAPAAAKAQEGQAAGQVAAAGM